MKFLLALLIANALYQGSYGQRSEEWYLFTPDKLNLYIYNIVNLSNWRIIKGGVAFFNQRSADIIYPTGTVKWNYTATFKNCKFPVTVINRTYDYFDNFTAISFKDLLSFYAAKQMTTVEAILREKNKTLDEFTRHNHWIEFENEFPILKVLVLKHAGHRLWMDDSKLFSKKLNMALNRK